MRWSRGLSHGWGASRWWWRRRVAGVSATTVFLVSLGVPWGYGQGLTPGGGVGRGVVESRYVALVEVGHAGGALGSTGCVEVALVEVRRVGGEVGRGVVESRSEVRCVGGEGTGFVESRTG